MTELRFESLTMPAADLGPENPLPALMPPAKAHAVQADASVSAEERKYLGYGCNSGVLPHRLQDGYSRQRHPRRFLAAVLENQILRATFLPEVGGRLWSLLHKPSGRAVLHVNPAFQPANLAIRNAWFSGGVEWNMGVVGHNPQTCSPLFAARVIGPDGREALRMYEWDRIRCAPYQIDAFLSDGSAFLFVRVGLVNPHDREIPMYWWSNIAVQERPDVRVLVPAASALANDYKRGFCKVPIPVRDATDQTYATNARSSADWFFCIPEGRRHWIAALDGGGRGLVQTSTSLLRGRKLFVWGVSRGGRRWQEFLSTVPGHGYFEIQAGLARTQRECVPMPGKARWSWLEAYGLMEADGPLVHGRDWDAACQDVEARLEAALPARMMHEQQVRADELAAVAPQEIVLRGSGWGALERRRRLHAGQEPFSGDCLPFSDESLGQDQTPWLTLLETGEMPCRKPASEPGAWMVQDEWLAMLEDALRAGNGDHWLSWLHLGVMYYHRGRTEEAMASWQKSIQLEPSAWAYRNLAVQARHEGRLTEAAELYLEAHRRCPALPALAVECLMAVIKAGRAADALALIRSLTPEVAARGRIRFLEALATLEAGDPERTLDLLRSEMNVPDVREGEVVLTDLWFAAHEKRILLRENVPADDDLRRRVRRDFPPPASLDFRRTE